MLRNMAVSPGRTDPADRAGAAGLLARVQHSLLIVCSQARRCSTLADVSAASSHDLPRARGRAASYAGGATQPDGAEDFVDALNAFARAVRRARGASTGAGDRGLTLSQFNLLEPLVERGEASVRGLADAAGVSAPTATRTLDPLERAGIVRRRRSAPDRRVVTVSLTPSGRDLLAGQRAWIAERQHALYASLAPGERASAAPLLNRLAVLVDELSAGPES
jgi:MarR family transcriptional regulator, organic hydroperoxide resistance regulator